MKQHIDALFAYIHEKKWDNMPEIIAELHGVLYEIGSQWEYYSKDFEAEEV